MTPTTRTRPGPDDRGSAIMLVIAFNAIMLSLTLAVLTFTTQAQKGTRADTDTKIAYQAALSGIDDYAYRLNNVPKYTRFSTSTAPCEGTGGPLLDPTNPAMNGWSTVGNSLSPVEYRYTVDTSTWCHDGTINVTAQGRSNSQVREVKAGLRKGQFVRNAYWSNYEQVNPARVYNDPFVPFGTTAVEQCTRHHYDPNSTSATRPDASFGEHPGCLTVNWVTDDNLLGPFHSNDAILVCGQPYFAGETTTSWPGVDPGSKYRYRLNPYCTNNAYFAVNVNDSYCDQKNYWNGEPCYAPPENFPSENPLQSIKAASAQGCVYTGPTRIDMHYDGRMSVKSPYTLTPSPGCPGNGTTGPIPDKKVVYIRDVPGGQLTAKCLVPLGGKLPQNILGFPRPTDITHYGCRTGDLFIKGGTRLNSTTFAADGRIILTGRVQTSTGGLDVPDRFYPMTGLATRADIEIYHPVTAAGDNAYDTDFTASGCANPSYNTFVAITPNGSFRAQNYNQGERCGLFSVNGSVINEYRGTLGTTDGLHGFRKSYQYDKRLRFRNPPGVPDPAGAAWRIAKIVGA